MAYEEADAGEVFGPVGELRGAAVPEVVGTDAIDFPRGEFVRFRRTPRGFEELRAQIVDAEDEPDVGTRSFECVARSIRKRKATLVTHLVDLACDREVGRARSKVLGASKSADRYGTQRRFPPEDDGVAHAVACSTRSSPLGELGQILDDRKGLRLIERDRFRLVSRLRIDGASDFLAGRLDDRDLADVLLALAPIHEPAQA